MLKPVDSDDDFLPENKLESLWLFCVVFQVNEETKDIEVEHMMSVEVTKPGAFKTAMTGSRADLEESWLFEAADKIPTSKSYGDVDDPDDLPQF